MHLLNYASINVWSISYVIKIKTHEYGTKSWLNDPDIIQSLINPATNAFTA